MRNPTPRALLLYFRRPSPPFSAVVQFERRGAECCSFSTASLSSGSAPTSQRQRNEEDSKGVKVTVWWDFENCRIPAGVSPYWVAHRITSALRSHGIRGPVSITAFGDMLNISHAAQDALCTTGISLNHVPNSGKNSADRSMLADLVYWVAQNPPPVHFFLISGDRDFANILHRLRMNNYNVLLAISDGASASLCSAATIMWHWNGLARGDIITGKHVNHPPDGSYGSWYGHYKGTIDDPFSDSEEVTDPKLRPVPKVLLKKIGNTLSLNPSGMTLSDLHRELKSSNVVLDKDFFGYKNFKSLIAAMPHIAKINPHPSGGLVTCSTRSSSTELVQPTLGPAAQKEVSHGVGDQTTNGEVNGKLPLSVSKPNAEEPASEKDTTSTISVSQSAVEEHSSTRDVELSRSASHTTPEIDSSGKVINADHGHKENIAYTRQDLNCEKDSTFQSGPVHQGEDGSLKRIWRSLFRSRPKDLNDNKYIVSKENVVNCQSSVEPSSSNILNSKDSEKDVSKGEILNSNRYHSDSCDSSFNYGKNLHANADNYEGTKNKDALSKGASSCSTVPSTIPNENAAAQKVDKPTVYSGIFSRIALWCNIWKTGSGGNEGTSTSIDNITNDQCKNALEVQGKETNHLALKPEPHDLFTKAHFWYSMESFFRTPKGSEIVSKSMSRIDIVHGLQKEGPLVLNSLKDCHIFHLVNLLISDKKWVDESLSTPFPFKLTLPVRRSCVPSHARGRDGLSHIFMNKASHSKVMVQRQENQDHNCQPVATSLNISVEKKQPRNLAELRVWYNKICDDNGAVQANDFKSIFEREFGGTLDSLFYGYFTVENLVAACSTNNRANQVKGRKASRLPKKQMLADCQMLLTEVLEECPAGILLSSFQPMFIERYGYDLDYGKLGYQNISSVLKTMPGVRIVSNLILPARKPSTDSAAKMPILNDTFGFNHEPGNKISDDEDCSWEELGPLEGNGMKVNGKCKNGQEEEIEFDESLSDEDSSDSENCASTGNDGFAVQVNKRKGEEDSSLLQILESWHSSKEGGEKIVPVADDPADSSGSHSLKPLEVPVSSSSQKVKPSKTYTFVSDSGDEKENIADDTSHC